MKDFINFPWRQITLTEMIKEIENEKENNLSRKVREEKET